VDWKQTRSRFTPGCLHSRVERSCGNGSEGRESESLLCGKFFLTVSPARLPGALDVLAGRVNLRRAWRFPIDRALARGFRDRWRE
jgi:hypothetical protein